MLKAWARSFQEWRPGVGVGRAPTAARDPLPQGFSSSPSPGLLPPKQDNLVVALGSVTQSDCPGGSGPAAGVTGQVGAARVVDEGLLFTGAEPVQPGSRDIRRCLLVLLVVAQWGFLDHRPK